MVEPEIYEFLGWVTGVAARFGLVVLPEVHDEYATHERLAARGFWTYDFVLPGLLLHAFRRATSTRLAGHLARSPDRQFTTLDSHDGIPVRPDLDGILEPAEMLRPRGLVQRQGGNVNRILSDSARRTASTSTSSTAPTTRRSDCDDERYLAARAIQLFARGVPQIYYVGLLAGENDRVRRAKGEGRAINRHDYRGTRSRPPSTDPWSGG